VRPSDSTNPYGMKGKNIFDLLQAAGVSWKVYVTDPFTNPANADTTLNSYSNGGSPNIVPVSQYFTDLQNGTLPSVAFIETGYLTGQDEHPNNNVQTGATYAASLINALMASSSWKSSVFMLTYDEGGQLYDHVPPQPAVSPDGIPPVDLLSNNVCSGQAGQQPACDFTLTGFRVPLLVISPFTKKHFVWQKVADYTAILKFIETRFKLSSLTKRDAAQPDMTEFFDFTNPPWLTPPSPPGQLNNGTCDFQSLQ
jgi:phospholipase C